MAAVLATAAGTACGPQGAGARGSGAAERATVTTPAELAGRASRAGPMQVVELVLTWDTAGLHFDPEHAGSRATLVCHPQSEECTEPAEGWDRAAVARGHRLRRIADRGDTAMVVVDYDRLGWVDGSIGIFDTPVTASDTVRLLRFAGAWRIVRSQLGLQLSPAAALRLYAGTAADSAPLLEAVRPR